MSRAIVTVGCSETRLFGPYLERFKRTFCKYGGADYLKIWHSGWPPGSPTHYDVHYAFKVHAVHEAFSRGHTSILWLDSSCNAFAPLDPMWERLERDGHVLINDDNKLGNWCGDHTLEVFGVTRDEAMKIHIMSGTCWGVDLRNPRSRIFLERLRSYATKEHFSGTHVSRLPGLPAHPRPDTEGYQVSNDERCWGHRSDETVSALLAREMGMITHTGVEFIGGCGVMNPRACIKSGYDLDVPPPAAGPSPPRLPNGLLDLRGIYDVEAD